MKKFGFIKKVTAAATAAAMIASFGISAFALEGNRGDKITIDKITYSDTETSGVYKITVDFTAEGTNEIGMTMLTYGMNPTTEGAEVDMVLNSSWTANQYDSETMKVIGVDQIPAVSVGDANNGKGRFEFNVSTNKGTDSIYLAKGKTALVALSGDGVNTPAVAPINIPVSASSASKVTISSLVLDANEDIESKVVEEVQKQTVTLYDGETVAAENVSLASAEKVGSVTINGNVYTGKVKLTSATGVSIGSDGILVPFEVTVSLNPVAAAEISKVDGKAAETDGSFAIAIEKGDAASVADITAKLKEKTADIVDSTEKITGKVALNDTNAEFSTESTFDAAAESQELTYTVTIKASAVVTGTEYLNVTTPLTATVIVTVSSAPVGDPVYLGDVNLDGVINAKDWSDLRNHIQGKKIIADLNDTTSTAFMAANVNKAGAGSSSLTASDWSDLRNHIQGKKLNTLVGTEIVGTKPSK